MEQKHGKKTKILNLVTSLLVTAVCILVWHFCVPYIKETKATANLVRLICYGILLFDTLWITDAALAFWRLPAELSEQEKTSKALTVYALVGFIVFLLFAALAHAVVAVFDGGNTAKFVISGFSKGGLSIIGFSLLLINSLHHEGRRLWTIISGVATFAIGIIFSTFLNLEATLGIMSGVVAIYFFADVFMISKKMEISPIHFSITAVAYIGIFALVILIVHFIPVSLGNPVATFVVRGVENLAFALIVDAAIIATHMIVRKKKAAEAK